MTKNLKGLPELLEEFDKKYPLFFLPRKIMLPRKKLMTLMNFTLLNGKTSKRKSRREKEKK